MLISENALRKQMNSKTNLWKHFLFSAHLKQNVNLFLLHESRTKIAHAHVFCLSLH